jgi:hypothetical protein
MNVDVEVKIIEDLPVEKIERYVDLCVFGVARNVLDFTLNDNRFPYLTGELQRSSIAEGVRQEAQNTYYLGAEGVDYAEKVWNYPQETTNWTNPDTYAQWYVKVYENKKELITQNTIDNAIRSVK